MGTILRYETEFLRAALETAGACILELFELFLLAFHKGHVAVAVIFVRVHIQIHKGLGLLFGLSLRSTALLSPLFRDHGTK